MSKPDIHAQRTARRLGGTPDDYLDIHEWFDHTKAHVPDMRHRLMLHNSWGIYLATHVFGDVRTNSDGRRYSVRDIGEQHVIDDLGKIPTLADCLAGVHLDEIQWIGGLTGADGNPRRRNRTGARLVD